MKPPPQQDTHDLRRYADVLRAHGYPDAAAATERAAVAYDTTCAPLWAVWCGVDDIECGHGEAAALKDELREDVEAWRKLGGDAPRRVVPEHPSCRETVSRFAEEPSGTTARAERSCPCPRCGGQS